MRFILQYLRMAHPCSELCTVNYCNTVRVSAILLCRTTVMILVLGFLQTTLQQVKEICSSFLAFLRMSDFCKCTALPSFKDVTVTVDLPPCVRLMTVNFYCFEICAPIRAPHSQQGTVKDYKGHLDTVYKKGVCKIKKKNPFSCQ